MRDIVIHHDCTGPNPACRKAARAGLTVHAIPPMRGLDEPAAPSLVLPTYHFATEAEAREAIATAQATAPTVATDDDLYAFRAAGIAHYLPVGWIDPTRR